MVTLDVLRQVEFGGNQPVIVTDPSGKQTTLTAWDCLSRPWSYSRNNERQLLALQYRLGTADDTPLTNGERDRFEAMIRACKQDRKLYPHAPGVQVPLSASDRAQMDKTIRDLPALVRALLRHGATDEWTKHYVKFCLRSVDGTNLKSNGEMGRADHWPRIFASYPHSVALMDECNLTKRFGAIDPELVQDENGLLRVKVDGAFQNIFGPGYEEMLRSFKAKTTGYGRHDVFGGVGIRTWNSIDVRDPFENLPVYQTLTQRQLKEKFPGCTLPKVGSWGIAFSANRQIPDRDGRLHALESHGFFYVLVPDGDSHKVYPIGFQSRTLPDGGALDGLRRISIGEEAGVHYPDEGDTLTQRVRGLVGFELSPEEVEALKTELKKKLVAARKGKLIFQTMGSNCAFFAAQMAHRVLLTRLLAHFEEGTRGLLLKALDHLDDAAVYRLVLSRVEQLALVADRDALHSLIGDAGQLLQRVLGTQSLPVITKDELGRVLAKETRPTEAEIANLAQSIAKLVQFGFHSVQFYRASTFNMFAKRPLIGPLLNFISKERPNLGLLWEPIRRVIFHAFLFILGYWVPRSIGDRRYALVAHPLLRRHELHLPPALFQFNKAKSQKAAEAARLFAQINSNPSGA